MSTIVIYRPDFLRASSYGMRNHHNLHKVSSSWTMTMNSKSPQKREKKELSIELQKLSVPQFGTISPSNLQFDRLQPADRVFIQKDWIDFEQFIAREAILDEEYWTAAWLRAESQWEDRINERYVDNYKRKFAEQEFNALKRRCKAQFGQKCICIVTVKKEEKNVKHTVLKSVVGTLDLSIQHLLHGANFPGERVKAPLFCSINRKGPRFGYITNLCVAKSARRQGIASNMLNFAIRSAKSRGAEQVFVHVHKKNKPAQQLYQKMGFEVVEMASAQLSAEQTFMLHFSA